MTRFVNLTPHMLNVVNKAGDVVNIPTSGTIARCAAETKEVDVVENFAITETRFGEVQGLPEPQEDVLFVVSRMVYDAAKRHDLVCPGPLVRDTDGKVIGCQGFAV